MPSKLTALFFSALLAGFVLCAGLPPASAASPAERLSVGLRAYQDGFYSLAAKELGAFLEAAPGDPRRESVLSLLAQAQIAQEQWGEARKTLLELAAGSGEQARAAPYWLGWVERKRREPRRALIHLQQYLQNGDTKHRSEALFLAGGTASELGLFEEASDWYARFLESAPGDPRRPRAQAGRVLALERSGASPAIVSKAVSSALDETIRDPDLYRQIVTAGIRAARAGERPRREAELWAALAARAASPEQQKEALFQEGMAWLRAEADAEGRRALEAYLAQEANGEQAVTAHTQLAGLARERKDWAAVLTHLEAALDVPAPQSAFALHKGAFTAAIRANRQDRAARHAQALLEFRAQLSSGELGTVHDLLARHLAPDDSEAAVRHWLSVPLESESYRAARLDAAAALLERGRPEAALEALAPLLEEDPLDHEVQGIALAAADAAKRWRRAAELALVLSEAAASESEGVEYLVRAVQYRERQGDATGKEAALRAVVERFPDHERAEWAALALQRNAFERGAWEDSLTWYDRLLAVAGGEPSPAARFLRAEALSRLGRTGQAEEEYRRVAGTRDELAGRAWVRLGSLLDQEGSWEEARDAYGKALAAGVPETVAAWVRERLSGDRPDAGPKDVPEQ